MGTANHDGDYVEDVTAVLAEGEDYIVFGISGTDMQAMPTEQMLDDFNAAADAARENRKVLIVMTHVPLHYRRSDNPAAAKWFAQINNVGVDTDVVVFWAHNHTDETEKEDIASYYIAKGDTMIPYGYSTGIQINFTYINAGYISPTNESARMGYMTILGISPEAIIVQGYCTEGIYDGDYKNNEDNYVIIDRTNSSDEDKTMDGIIAAFIPADESGKYASIYEDTAVGELKQYITVNTIYSDNSIGEIITDYECTLTDDDLLTDVDIYVITVTAEVDGEEYTADYSVTVVHNYSDYYWKWTEKDGEYTAEVVFVCENCSEETEDHFMEVEAAVTSETDESDGSIVYTATLDYKRQKYTSQFVCYEEDAAA